MIPELENVIRYLESIPPRMEITMAIINIDGQWLFFDEDYNLVNIPLKADISIFEKAENAIYEKYGFPYVYQKVYQKN